jgi:hypothetical protein
MLFTWRWTSIAGLLPQSPYHFATFDASLTNFSVFLTRSQDFNYYVSWITLELPPLCVQEHIDLLAYYFGHCPYFWHQPLLPNFTPALNWRLRGMNSSILCFLVRASSYILISRPTDATSDRFLFSIYMCITLHVSSVTRSSSGVPHRIYSLQFLCLYLFAALSCKKLKTLTRQCRRQTKTQKLEAVCMVRDSWRWALDARNM